MSPLIQDVLIFGAFALSMLLRDVTFTIETKADANNSVVLAAVADVLGDGLSSLTNIFTIAIVAAGLSRGGEVAQIAGNMAGGFIGVVVGNHVSLLLDRTISGYHRHPSRARVAHLADTIVQAIHMKRTAPPKAAPPSGLGTFRGRTGPSPSYDRVQP